MHSFEELMQKWQRGEVIQNTDELSYKKTFALFAALREISAAKNAKNTKESLREPLLFDIPLNLFLLVVY